MEPTKVQNKFIQFLHENFSNLADDHTQDIQSLYATLKTWTNLEAKKEIVKEIKNLFLEKPYIETIRFSGEWSYLDSLHGYTYEFNSEPVLRPGNYGDYETEVEQIKYDILINKSIGKYLEDFTLIEREQIIQGLGLVNASNVDNKLNDILYEEEEQLDKDIQNYEKNLFASELPVNDAKNKTQKFKV